MPAQASRIASIADGNQVKFTGRLTAFLTSESAHLSTNMRQSAATAGCVFPASSRPPVGASSRCACLLHANDTTP